MSILFTAWDFFKKHKGKIAIASGVVASLYANKYLTSIEQSWHQNSARSFTTEAYKKEYHFEDTIQKCNLTVLNLSPKILKSLDGYFKIEDILEELKAGSQNKLFLWQELKIKTFTRMVSEIYCLCYFVCFMRVQMSVITGYLYLDNSKTNKSGVDHIIQMKYLSLLSKFYEKGLKEFIEPIQDVIINIVGSLDLKLKLCYQDIREVFEQVRNFDLPLVRSNQLIATIFFTFPFRLNKR